MASRQTPLLSIPLTLLEFDEYVAWVEVAVDDVVREDHLEEGLDANVREPLAKRDVCGHELVDGDALFIRLDKHAFRHVRPMYPGKLHIPGIPEVVRELLDVVCFQSEIKLRRHQPLKLAHAGPSVSVGRYICVVQIK